MRVRRDTSSSERKWRQLGREPARVPSCAGAGIMPVSVLTFDTLAEGECVSMVSTPHARRLELAADGSGGSVRQAHTPGISIVMSPVLRSASILTYPSTQRVAGCERWPRCVVWPIAAFPFARQGAAAAYLAGPTDLPPSRRSVTFPDNAPLPTPPPPATHGPFPRAAP